MSPLFIIILMLSSCVLLGVLLMVLRKKEQAKKNTIPETEKKPEPEVLPEKPAPVTPTLDLSAFEGLNLDSLMETPATKNSDKTEGSDLLEFVSRHKFFQGKNLEVFGRLLQESNWQSIEALIQEKFEAQKKDHAKDLSKEVTGKLMAMAM